MTTGIDKKAIKGLNSVKREIKLEVRRKKGKKKKIIYTMNIIAGTTNDAMYIEKNTKRYQKY
ncbi:MAG: hypothetical protein ACXAES_04725 [Promethearchaeota archaeon]|jgi:hypothetical protein